MCLSPINIKISKDEKTFRQNIPCGKCVECERARCIEFSLRAMDEASLHEHNCCVTLTYNDDFLPKNQSVNKLHFQTFIKHLRNKGIKCRYFGSGEYGSRFGRPHYHIILFGYQPPIESCIYLFTKNGIKYYRSHIFDDAWSIYLGNNIENKPLFVPLGFVTFSFGLDQQTAFYCAKYLQKKAFSDDGRTPPFSLMSKKPGIGFGKITESMKDSGVIYRDGKTFPIPKYYARKLGITKLPQYYVRANMFPGVKLKPNNNSLLTPEREELKQADREAYENLFKND